MCTSRIGGKCKMYKMDGKSNIKSNYQWANYHQKKHGPLCAMWNKLVSWKIMWWNQEQGHEQEIYHQFSMAQEGFVLE